MGAENGSNELRARSHLILSGIFQAVGDGAACLDHALRALELADETTAARTRGNFVLGVADAFTAVGSFDSARQRYGDAEKLFASIGDVERQISAINNRAYNETMAGNLEEARSASEKLRELAITNGIVLNPVVLHTLARVHAGLGELTRGEAAIQTALEALERYGDAEASSPAAFLLTLAEIHRRQGRLALAQRTLDYCRTVCQERGLVSVEVEVLREQAELHASANKFDEAFNTFKLYHERAVRISSSQREAAARTRQALFETAEARQEAQRYWRQARTDELTRLPNRQFVDEELPARLGDKSTGKPLVVAIVDADHFKSINDTLSHDVGDKVIRELARVFQASIATPNVPLVYPTVDDFGSGAPELMVVAEGSDESQENDVEEALNDGTEAVAVALNSGSRFVARLGGEEFLVVIPGMDPRGALDVLDGLRAAVERHDWRELVGSHSVTVSIGATSSMPHDMQGVVLSRADRCLYAAKRAGRNRVVVDFNPQKQLGLVLTAESERGAFPATASPIRRARPGPALDH